MTYRKLPHALLVCSLSAFILAACSSDNDSPASTDTTNETDAGDGTDTGTDNTVGSFDVTAFLSDALAEDISIVDCTLSGGTETTCYQIVIAGTPADAAVGPFCPTTIEAGADDVGIWFDGGDEVYDLDGVFIQNLPNIYGDQNWQLYDETTGEVYVTDTQIACEAAARPDVDPEYQNHCVECSLDYYGGGISQTFLIPTTPVAASAIGNVGTASGVAINGVVLAAAAPVADILSNYTIAAFDDCGGHINPNDGYHYHASTDCNASGTQSDGHASLLGLALDGYAIYGQLDSTGNAHSDLDECRGASDDTRGYHYHAAAASDNMFIGCFTGETEGEASDNGPGGPGGPGGPPQ